MPTSRYKAQEPVKAALARWVSAKPGPEATDAWVSVEWAINEQIEAATKPLHERIKELERELAAKRTKAAK